MHDHARSNLSSPHVRSVGLLRTVRLTRIFGTGIGVGGGLFMLFWAMGAFLIVSDPLPEQSVDAVVPLAGNPERLQYAVELLQEGQARWLLITNMYIPDIIRRNVRNVYSTLTTREAVEYGASLEQIFVAGQPVKTTYQEMRVLRQFAEQQGWTSLIVVTSPSHTRRSRMMLDEVFAGTGVQVTVRPVATNRYAPATWWMYQHGWQQTVTEYLKLVVYLVGYRG